MTIPRPSSLFDREAEWTDLSRFGDGSSDVRRIGLVYGRRRQGKSFMLEHLARSTNGFYYQALEEARASALERFATQLAAFSGATEVPVRGFDDWAGAFRAAASLAGGRPIIIDEFPYLLREAPELPSLIQDAYDGVRFGRHPAFRLILCGSALSVMSKLLTGTQALRGRAQLDMPVRSFDFREARSFWQIEDIQTAFLVHAVLGGPPGYRDLVEGATPGSVAEFADWLTATVLNPSHALFREAEYLLSEDPGLIDRALYRSILAVIAGGETTRRGVGVKVDRPETALDHQLGQLERAGFILRDADLLRPNRPLLRIADPLLRFHFAVLRPDLARFEMRQTQAAWQDAERRFRSIVLGPQFESLARTWAATFASSRTLGGHPRQVGFVQVNDREQRQAFELDVVAEAEGPRAGGKPRLLAIGEAKAGDRPRTVNDLRRLERLRGELAGRAEVGRTRLLLFGRSGFDTDLVEAVSRRRDVELIDLQRIYEGD
jgi:Archaeal ATPase.